MKDLIAKLQLDANCALGAIWMHIDAQSARIAELEAQIAARAAPVVEQQPIARLTTRDQPSNLFDIITLDRARCKDGMALYAAPQATDTDKLREAILALRAPEQWDFAASPYYHGIAAAARLVSSTALQAPVREVPGWISVEDRRPTDHTKCYLVFSNWGIRFARKHEDNWANGCFQDTDSDSDEGMLGWDSVEGPFTVTHWMELPALSAAPVQQEGDHG